MVELDVRKLGDGTLVAYHYQLLNGKLVRRLSYGHALELSKKSGYEIPTLEQAFKLMSGKIKVNIELKEKGYEDKVLDLALKYFTPEHIFITSFLCSVVLYCKQHYPQIKTGLLLEPLVFTIYNAVRYVDLSYFIGSLLKKQQASEAADFLSIWENLYDIGIMDEQNFKNKSCLIYPVNRENKIRGYFNRSNVFGIISDRPDLALKIRTKFYAP